MHVLDCTDIFIERAIDLVACNLLQLSLMTHCLSFQTLDELLINEHGAMHMAFYNIKSAP